MKYNPIEPSNWVQIQMKYQEPFSCEPGSVKKNQSHLQVIAIFQTTNKKLPLGQTKFRHGIYLERGNNHQFFMALQTGASASKVLILVGAGLTGSVVLQSGKLSDVIAQLQELLKDVNAADILPEKCDSAILAAKIQQLAQEIKELNLSNPITIFNGNPSSSGSFGSYVLPAAAVGAIGYGYMWLKGWSFSDVMFVTKHNMKNAVSTVSKQLEHVTEALALTKKHLSKRLENLDWKLEEQKQISDNIANNVNEVNSNLSRIGCDVDMIHQMVAGLEGKLELLENKQDMTNSGLWHLCQVAGGFKDGLNGKVFQDVSSKITNHSTLRYEEKAAKGLQFFVDNKDSIDVDESIQSTKKIDTDSDAARKLSSVNTRIHRSYPVGFSLTRNFLGPEV